MSGDPDALERVLRNLINNDLAAIKPTGRIDVEVRRLNGDVQALVTDDGPGVPEPERQRIFERFARQHQGDLTCGAMPTGGSFTLRLPTQI